jgi:hypothetical protein
MAVITFSSAYTTAPIVVLTAANAATAPLNVYVSASATGTFTVSCTGTPASSQANTIYAFNYIVLARPN